LLPVAVAPEPVRNEVCVSLLPFEKWHGLGNDFVVAFEADGWRLSDGQRAVALCDRHRGIGADGLLIVGASPARMTVFNADGSESEMCGNGLRCVSAAIATRAATSGWFDVETGAGPHATRLLTSGEVELLMPRPRLMPDVTGSALVRPRAGLDAPGYRLSTGNPHWVFLDLENPPDIAIVGPLLELDPQFPDRVNIEFVRLLDDGALRVDVWERGCGQTQACGTGAAAVAELWRTLGRIPVDESITVELPGGRLHFGWLGERLLMRGPAERAFAGTVAR
jgi:diaminopimelate epimerase